MRTYYPFLFQHFNVALLLVFGFTSYSVAADKDVIWESGHNLFIKFVKQDKSKSGQTPPNNHPVELKEDDITGALDLLKIWDEEYYDGEALEGVFTLSQSRLLGNELAKGLKIADPKQDIIFAIVASKKTMLGLPEPRYMSGRVFYYQDRLNIIIGEYDYQGQKLKENVYGSFNVDVRYQFTKGKRAKASRKFKKHTIKVEGIENAIVNAKQRKDWFLIDIENAKKVTKANAELKRRSSKEYQAELEKQLEAKKHAKDRREMRLEMARIRKEMKEGNNNSKLSIEERLKNLEKLKTKELISDDEYQKKRTEILNDL